MSEGHHAVFLSYASQDSEAAKRICEALRAAGVEVWFDQNELVGGDAWDAKIRGQIASCSLFVPIISANTQARREGYFRIEWKLAAQRTHAMADGTPFLLPVVIDGTRDTEALVPAEFRAVQWTRLPNGETPKRFTERVERLLSANVDDGVPTPKKEGGAADRSASPGSKRRSWILYSLGSFALVVVALFISRFRHDIDSSPPASLATPSAPAPLSETRLLVGKAWILLNKPSMARAELIAADDLCKKASVLDSTDPEVWAAWATVHTWYVFHNLDASDARRTAARDAAARAIQLDPQSFEARLAQAFYWGRGDSVKRTQESGNWERPQRKAAIALLEELLRERPDEPRVLLHLGFLLAASDRGLKLLEQAAANPAFAAVAWDELGWHFLNGRGDYRRAEEAVDKSLAVEAYWNNLTLKIRILAEWHRDLDGALTQLERMPASALQEDWAVAVVQRVRGWRREPQEMLRFLERVPTEWLSSNWYEGPKALNVADARRMAGQTEAARRDYRRALAEVETRLTAAPNDANLLALRAECLYRLEDYEEAWRSFRGYREVNPPGWVGLNLLFATPDERIAQLEALLGDGGSWPTAALLQIEPWFDVARNHPRFIELVRRAEADPKRAPQKSPAAKNANHKSVAVLAFANLSDDKSNEYFSDGISEELLNVLAKIPGLKVSARTSAFYFKGKEVPVPEIAQKLSVAYVVEGSVRKQGDKVRITAQLIKAADGFHVWSDTFTRELKDVFAVQDEIAGAIAKKLELTLNAAASSPADPEVLPLYYAALQAWNLRTLEGMDRAESLLGQVLERAPQFARGHAALAMVWCIRGELLDQFTFGQREGPLAQKVATRVQLALDLDPNCAEAHAAAGLVDWDRWRWDDAVKALRRAIALNPNYASAHQWLGRVLANQGLLDESIAELRQAAELDPLSARILDNNGRALLLANRPAEAATYAERALAIQPGGIQPRAVLAQARQDLGDKNGAVELARALPAELTIASIYKVRVLARAGEKAAVDQLLPGLTRGHTLALIGALAALGRPDEALIAFDPEWITANRADWLLFEPALDPLRSTPRFQLALATLGLTEAHARAQQWRQNHL